MRISFAWWNTSLAPLGKSRATEKEKAVALSMIKHLVEQLDIDCLALGEVTAEDIQEFRINGNLWDYGLYERKLNESGYRFDIGVLYRKERLHLIDAGIIVSRRGTRSLKVATKLEFRAPQTNDPLHVFVSHWPSRLWCERNGADRHTLGLRLREAIEKLSDGEKDPIYVILLGDFNDEPFDASISEQLLATRDRSLVYRKPQLLYNPFWRHLGESQYHEPGVANSSYCGSYHYQSGFSTRCHTFDQIMFSASFLGQGDWHLNEKYTQILRWEPFDALVYNSKEIFDHFPVISVIEREEYHG